MVMSFIQATNDRGLDPNIVKPGWTALGIVVLLAVVVAFLGRSFARQRGMLEANFDAMEAAEAAKAAESGQSTSDR